MVVAQFQVMVELKKNKKPGFKRRAAYPAVLLAAKDNIRCLKCSGEGHSSFGHSICQTFMPRARKARQNMLQMRLLKEALEQGSAKVASELICSGTQLPAWDSIRRPGIPSTGLAQPAARSQMSDLSYLSHSDRVSTAPKPRLVRVIPSIIRG